MVPAYGPKSAYVMELDLLCRSEVKVSVSCIQILRRWAIGRYCAATARHHLGRCNLRFGWSVGDSDALAVVVGLGVEPDGDDDQTLEPVELLHGVQNECL